MAEEIKDIFITKDPMLSRYLQSISNRLDQLEGLRNNPKFFKDTFHYSGDSDISAGQVLKASSSSEASFDDEASVFSSLIIGDTINGNYCSIGSDGTIIIYADNEIVHKLEGGGT